MDEREGIGVISMACWCTYLLFCYNCSPKLHIWRIKKKRKRQMERLFCCCCFLIYSVCCDIGWMGDDGDVERLGKGGALEERVCVVGICAHLCSRSFLCVTREHVCGECKVCAL